MARNVEIKAHARDLAALAFKAQELSGDPALLLHQHDTFFNCPSGRLKLRILGNGQGELIYYRRPDQPGPKTSEYERSRTTDPEPLRRLLANALGTCGAVRKKRAVYLVGHTRVHLDEVEGLGNFLELEVVLADDETSAYGEDVARDLMQKLGVKEDDLVTGAYLDLLKS